MNAPAPRAVSRIATTRVSLSARWTALAAVSLLFAVTPFAAYGHGGALELSLAPDTVAAGQEINLSGEGFAADATLEVHLTGPNGDAHFDNVTADDEGAFTQAVQVPGTMTPGIYLVRVAGDDREASAELTIGAMAGMGQASPMALPERERPNSWRAVALALFFGAGIVGFALARPGRPGGLARVSS